MTSPLLPRQTLRLPNTQGLASLRLGHRSPSPPRSSPRRPSRGAEKHRGVRGGISATPPPPQCCRLKDEASGFIPCLGLGACPGLPAPTHRCHGVLGDNRGGQTPTPRHAEGARGGDSSSPGWLCRRVPCSCWLCPSRKVGQGHLQALAIINPAQAGICHWGWSGEGPAIPNICGRERGRQRAIGEVLGDRAGSVLSAASCGGGSSVWQCRVNPFGGLDSARRGKSCSCLARPGLGAAGGSTSPRAAECGELAGTGGWRLRLRQRQAEPGWKRAAVALLPPCTELRRSQQLSRGDPTATAPTPTGPLLQGRAAAGALPGAGAPPRIASRSQVGRAECWDGSGEA